MRIALLLLCLSGCLTPPFFVAEEAATIHPGMRLFLPAGDAFTQCTAGFLFSSPDASTRYVSLSAHCLHAEADLGIGDAVYAAPAGHRPIGVVAFDGWAGEHSRERDFALVRLAPGVRADPEVPTWGGPLGIARGDDVAAGTFVVAYGNSALRPDPSQNAAVGWLTFASTGNVVARFDRPALPGDSGGPLLTVSGLALGTLHGSASSAPGTGGAELDVFTPLAPALAMVRREGPPGTQEIALVTTTTWVGPMTPPGAANGPPSSALPNMP